MSYEIESAQQSLPKRLLILALEFASCVLLLAWAAVFAPCMLADNGLLAEYGQTASGLMVVIAVGLAASLALRALRSFGFDFGTGANPLAVVSVLCPLAAVVFQAALVTPFVMGGLPATGEVHDDAVELALSILITVAMFVVFAVLMRKWDFGRGFALAFCAMHELAMLPLLPYFARDAVSLVPIILFIPLFPFLLIGSFFVVRVVARSS